MSILNLQDKFRSYYTASEQPEIVDIPEATYIAIHGKGSPGTNVFYKKKKAITQFVEELQKKYAETGMAFISKQVLSISEISIPQLI